jgi:hypothetical protein
VSGNPSGRAKKTDDERTVDAILRAAGPDAARKLVAMLDCGDPAMELKAAQSILDKLIGDRVIGMADENKDGAIAAVDMVRLHRAAP